MSRENHETMTGDFYKKGSITLMFMSFFKSTALLTS